jgi:hypothetical protein
MSTILERVYASAGPEVAVATLELASPAWATPLLLCQDYASHTFTTEDGRTLTFDASAIAVAIPKRDNSGSQGVSFAIDGVTGEAQQRIDAAQSAEQQVSLTLRIYLANQPEAPAEPPYRMIVRGGVITDQTVQIEAAQNDLINTMWPRLRYTTAFAPGLTYM